MGSEEQNLRLKWKAGASSGTANSKQLKGNELRSRQAENNVKWQQPTDFSAAHVMT